MAAVKPERRPEGEVSFLAVASPPPRACDVVEPALCLGCLTRFYRPKPALAQLGEKFCRACTAREEARKAAAAAAPRQTVQRYQRVPSTFHVDASAPRCSHGPACVREECLLALWQGNQKRRAS